MSWKEKEISQKKKQFKWTLDRLCTEQSPIFSLTSSDLFCCWSKRALQVNGKIDGKTRKNRMHTNWWNFGILCTLQRVQTKLHLNKLISFRRVPNSTSSYFVSPVLHTFYPFRSVRSSILQLTPATTHSGSEGRQTASGSQIINK